MTLTKQHRDSFARTLRYMRKTIRARKDSGSPHTYGRDFNTHCIIQSLKKEGVQRDNAKECCIALDAARYE